MKRSAPDAIVTADDLDGRLAFVLGLKGPQYRHELTRHRLGRRLAAVAGLPVPDGEEGLEFLIEVAQITQDTILRNGHPPYWSEGHLSNLVFGLVSQRVLDDDPALVDRLVHAFFDSAKPASAELQLAYARRDLAAVPGTLSIAVAHLLAAHGYVRLFGGKWGPAPHVEEAADSKE